MSFFNEFNSFFIQMKIPSGFSYAIVLYLLHFLHKNTQKAQITERNSKGKNIQGRRYQNTKGFTRIYINVLPEETHKKQPF